MNLDIIEKSVKELKFLRTKLKKLEEGELNIELRVFTEGWTNFEFNPKNKAIKNMVIHQIRIELKDEIKKNVLIIRDNVLKRKQP